MLAGIGGCPHHQRAPAVHTALPVSPTRLLLLMLPTSNQETMLPGQVPGATGDALPGPSPAGADRLLRRDRAALRNSGTFSICVLSASLTPKVSRFQGRRVFCAMAVTMDTAIVSRARARPFLVVGGRQPVVFFAHLVLFLSSDASPHGCRGASLLRCGRRRSGITRWSSSTPVSCELSTCSAPVPRWLTGNACRQRRRAEHRRQQSAAPRRQIHL